MKKTYQTGIDGELSAAEWMKAQKGMKLVEKRYRNKAGEIDLIMLDGDTIVFVEVKTRLHAAPGSGMLAVDIRKQHRIAHAAMLYLMENGWLNRRVRFDVVEVTESRIAHISNAFQPGHLFYL